MPTLLFKASSGSWIAASRMLSFLSCMDASAFSASFFTAARTFSSFSFSFCIKSRSLICLSIYPRALRRFMVIFSLNFGLAVFSSPLAATSNCFTLSFALSRSTNASVSSGKVRISLCSSFPKNVFCCLSGKPDIVLASFSWISDGCSWYRFSSARRFVSSGMSTSYKYDGSPLLFACFLYAWAVFLFLAV